MILLRKILFPFAILYGLITQLRNFLYDQGILKSYGFDVPVIAIGNLSVGGTGKTPMTEYLIRLLSENHRIAVLSRGYKRVSSGFVLGDATSDAKTLGDEPFQIHQKFPKIQVAVDADRKNGIEQLLSQNEPPQIILLDDAFQHRKVKAGFYILLTAYDDLFCDDFMLPTGNLRESRSGAKRADVIVVTKCPPISEAEQQTITKKIGGKQPVFFSSIAYDDQVFGENASKAVAEIKGEPKLLVTGIAKPKPFLDYLKNENDRVLTFPDHHDFDEKDIQNIKTQAQSNLIVTTEKDYVRLQKHIAAPQLYYLPIKTAFISGATAFESQVLNYVGEAKH